MYGVELYIDGKWVYINTRSKFLTYYLYQRALDQGHFPARRVKQAGARRVALDFPVLT